MPEASGAVPHHSDGCGWAGSHIGFSPPSAAFSDDCSTSTAVQFDAGVVLLHAPFSAGRTGWKATLARVHARASAKLFLTLNEPALLRLPDLWQCDTRTRLAGPIERRLPTENLIR